MNVLIVTHHYLCGNGGGVFASRAYINAIVEIVESVTLLYPYKEGAEPEFLDERVNAVPVRYDKPKIGKLLDLLKGKVHRYNEAFKNEINEHNYDLVIFDSSLASFKLIDFAHAHHLKVITIHHNYQYEYFRDATKWPLKPIILFWTKRYEYEAVRYSDLNLTLTEQDIILLANVYNNGDKGSFRLLGCFEFQKNHIEKSEVDSQNCDLLRFLITGSLDATQNKRSIIPWLHHYYPILKELIPNSTLVIAGKNPSSEYEEICNKLGVTLIASPKDMQPIIDEANIYICPMNLGGGLKLRVMDGLKNGLPVLCHEISARGYDEMVRKGYVFVYHDMQSFIENVNKISSSVFDRDEIIEAYNMLFSFEAGVDRLRDVLTNMFDDVSFAKKTY